MFPAFLGVVELIFLGVFFLLLVLGTAFDRHGTEEPKWYIFGIGLVAIGAWFWKDLTVVGVWETVSSWSFWAPTGAYLLAGLVYSLLEFFLDVRRSARWFSAKWQDHLSHGTEVPVLNADGSPKREVVRNNWGKMVEEDATRMQPNSELYADVRDKGAESTHYNRVLAMTADFIRGHSSSKKVIQLETSSTSKLDIEPRVNRVQLAEHIGAWTFFWPAYFVSLIIGDLLTEVFKTFADILANLSGRFVKLSFSDVFKI